MSGMSYEFSARSVDAAIAEGLRQLNVGRHEVEIEVLHEGSRGLLGIGSSNARIRITIPPKPAPAPQATTPEQEVPSELESVEREVAAHTSIPATEAEAVEPSAAPEPAVVVESQGIGQDDPGDESGQPSAPPVAEGQAETFASLSEAVAQAEIDGGDADSFDDYDEDENKAYDSDIDPDELAELASSMLVELLAHMGFETEVEVNWPEKHNTNAPLNLNVVGENLGMLIGRHGETLASIQYLIRLMVNQRIHRWTNIVVDVDGYKAHRAEQLAQMASRMAEQVVQSGRAMALEPMPANERRLVHIALRNHPRVYTESVGEAERRKVQILLK